MSTVIRVMGRWSAVLVCVVFVLVSCSVGRQSVAIDYHNPLSEKMSALKADRGTAPLNTMTDFGWDQVYLFHESAARADIEKLVGEPIIKEKFYGSSSSLLIFKREGEVVRAVGLTADYLRAATAGPFGPDVIAQPWGNGAMQLVEPSANPSP